MALLYYTPGSSIVSPVVTRSTVALYWDRSAGLFKEAAIDTLRDNHWVQDPATGVWQRTALLEGSQENLVLQSGNFDTTWVNNGGLLTLEDAVSIMPEQFATKATNDGGGGFRALVQETGTLTASPETCDWILERVDTTASEVGVYDGTVGDWVVRLRLTWSTLDTEIVQSGSGSSVLGSVVSSGVGPNGGIYARIKITGTPDNAGNARYLYCYPTGAEDTNEESVIVHHIQHTTTGYLTSPIITEGTAVTRGADSLAFTETWTSQTTTRYLRYLDLATRAFVDAVDVDTRTAPETFESSLVDRAYTHIVYLAGAHSLTSARNLAFASSATRYRDRIARVPRIVLPGGFLR